MAKNYAEQLVETLEAQGVERIYGLVGDSLNPIVDAVRRSSIDWVHVRNEEAAAFAAEADSLTTGKLAVCAASCGPGNTHLVQGLYDAHRNGAKVLAIASHIPSRQIGSKFFQETHPEMLFNECSAYCEMVNSADQGGVILHHAIQSTMAGKGVSVLVIPGDVSTQEAGDDTFTTSTISAGRPVVFPDPAEAAALTQAINEAKTVALFVGAGVKDAREQVLALAEKIKAPIGHALGGKMYIQYDNPFDVGMSGLLGYGAAHDATHEADLLILLGTDFPYNDFLPKENVAQVDIDGSHIGRRTKIKYPVTGDVAATIENILPHIDEKKDRRFLDKMLKEHYNKLNHVVEAYTKKAEKMKPIHPEFVANIIDEEAADDAVFTVDTGMCNVWGARYITPNGKREQIGSFRHGTMANALPMAIGAQAANEGRQVISFSGDGGLSMLMGELLTVKLHNLPVKTFVFNNSSLGMVKLEMLVQGLPEHETDHAHVDYAAIAEAAGIKHIRIEDPKKARKQIREAMDFDGPVLVDMVTDPNALSIPPTLTFEQLLGFSKAATRTVFGGGVGQMLQLAQSNLRNIPRP
ncbi:pyruvate dehydrogenase [Corynebacterium striatum]|uniref:Pyruvate dehydrogenase n=1 Tax=Corynebacterium striatum TaxID=43770 RepID=A0AAQ1TXC3_CORST|nr:MULTISPECIES: pyruvate dehydrogenase [Corynebacterium]EEI77113.1 thiamine pyrophosphate enzyme, C-terminal TPP binding domain protein [Corynebacterium striatum ATCC 6940]KAA1271859.1 pyruvate dehydrogenase [Corynebacterium striatum]MDC7106109.1 pyruvate dehydrogenase [Corynebacterium striatum]MDK8787758.1 pyruvate dehydrogenase [Corynebacterium striatum]MDK8831602.1 pyruvate dehydrogenase [Corynebacterium striatum]